MIDNAILISTLRRDNQTLDYAIVKASHHNSGGRHNIWAVATDNKNNILAQAGNYYDLTHPMQSQYCDLAGRRNNRTLHAEINVLIKLQKINQKASKLFIARSGYLQRSLLAKPCKTCMTALLKSDIEKIFWTTDYRNLKPNEENYQSWRY